jgi:hypothetical protein
MAELINIALALTSIALGGFGWLAPRYTLETLDLQTNGSTMGLSEMRASAGALFIGLGLGALYFGTPEAYAMVGFAWGGAAVGRVTSLVKDDAPTRKTYVFAAIEITVAGLLLAINL